MQSGMFSWRWRYATWGFIAMIWRHPLAGFSEIHQTTPQCLIIEGPSLLLWVCCCELEKQKLMGTAHLHLEGRFSGFASRFACESTTIYHKSMLGHSGHESAVGPTFCCESWPVKPCTVRIMKRMMCETDLKHIPMNLSNALLSLLIWRLNDSRTCISELLGVKYQ